MAETIVYKQGGWLHNGHLSIEQIKALSQQESQSSRQENAEDWSHVEKCDRCRNLIEKCRSIDARLGKIASANLPKRSGMNCPDQNTWFEVAAGALPDEESLQYLEHAATCNDCGKKLKIAVQIFEQELSPEDERILAALPGIRDSQIRLAAQSSKLVPTQIGSKPANADKPRRSFWWVAFYAVPTAAVIAIAALLLIPKQDPLSKAEHLLAQAYTENRQMEMRIPYARHAPIRQQRGGDADSLLNAPESFRKAADQIATGVRNHPDDPKWLTQQAQLDLLDFRYKAALSTLGKIENPGASADILLVRAIALFEEGQTNQDQANYKEAINLLQKILQKEPDNTVVLFNEALLCEKSEMRECAARDWERVIALEQDPGWAKEAQDHLDSIQRKKKLAY